MSGYANIRLLKLKERRKPFLEVILHKVDWEKVETLLRIHLPLATSSAGYDYPSFRVGFFKHIPEVEETLESQPAAERTALENLHDSIEAMRQEARRNLRNPPDDGVSKNFDVAFFGGKSLGLLRARQEVDKLLSKASQR